MNELEPVPIAADDRNHHYRGNKIPWFVRVMWIGFWIFAIFYTLRFLVPSLQTDLFRP